MITEAPVRKPSISETRVNGDRYAWGKTGREICAPHFEAAWNNTKGNFTTVDLCSSTPMLSQIWRENRRRNCYEEATKAVGQLAQTLDRKVEKTPLQSMKALDPQLAVQLRNSLTPKHSSLRGLLTAVIHDMLYDPPRLNPWVDQRMQLTAFIKDALITSTYQYHLRFERGERIGQGRWQILIPENVGFNFAVGVESIVGPQNNDFLDLFLDDIAGNMVDYCSSRLRRFTAVSLDCENPETLMRKAQRSFPDDYWNTEFFRRIRQLSGGNHIVGDVMPRIKHKDEIELRRRGVDVSSGLPFRRNSVSFLTCIEGWPFYFKSSSKKNQFDLAQSIGEVLQLGGRAVFFPWEMWKQSKRDKSTLDQIEKVWKKMGIVVLKEKVWGDQLIEKMSDRELALTNLSPVFNRPRIAHTILVLIKLHPTIESENQPPPLSIEPQRSTLRPMRTSHRARGRVDKALVNR